MLSIFQKNKAPRSTAKVVDGSLVLSLGDAVDPVVWRMELGSVKASAMEIKKEPESPHHFLTLKTAKGDIHKIAPYETRDQALNALMAIAKALETAPQTSQLSDGTATIRPLKRPFSILKTVFVIVSVIAILLVGMSFFSMMTMRGAGGITPAASSAALPDTEPAQSGVPIPADDLLRGF